MADAMAELRKAHKRALDIIDTGNLELTKRDEEVKHLQMALIKVGAAILNGDPKQPAATLFMSDRGDGTIIQFINDITADKRHPDDKAVDQFVQAMGSAMKAKLAKKRDEGYSQWWDKHNFPWEVLIKQMLAHIQKGDPVDVANYCMFLYHRGERTDGGHISVD